MNKLYIYLLRAIQWRIQNLLISMDHSLEYRQSVIDEKQLVNARPKLLDIKLIEHCKKTLEPAYLEYISTISEEVHAISLEQAAFLLNYCNVSNPKSIIDFGSGFSSYVLRLYSKGKMVDVCSVDDSDSWLQKTTMFLQEKSLSVDSMFFAGDFFESKNLPVYDLLYYDLGIMETRKKYLTKILDLFALNQFATLLIDDVHMSDYRNLVTHSLKERSLDYHNLKRATIDKFGRYAYMVNHTDNKTNARADFIKR